MKLKFVFQKKTKNDIQINISKIEKWKNAISIFQKINFFNYTFHTRIGFGIKTQNSLLKQKSKFQSVHRKCHSIFILKLGWKMTFLCISVLIQNWKLKKDNFQFSTFIEKWKIKFSFFTFQFSFYFKILNYHLSN